MAYYTERNGMRKPIERTHDITIDKYALLLDCCEKYYNNLAWKFPEQCLDGYGCCGLDAEKFNRFLKYDIPTLYRNTSGEIAIPGTRFGFFSDEQTTDEYDQFALLDFIEFVANNIHDVTVGKHHMYYGHNHLILRSSNATALLFKDEVNEIFQKTGLLYRLNDDLQIERIVERSPLTSEMEKAIAAVKELGTRELLQDAIAYYKEPRSGNRQIAVEKMWDAFERLKSYYPAMKKNESADKVISNMAAGQPAYIELFTAEFKALTKIGNEYRIRHHETDKIEITDLRLYDYFFNRCLSLLALAIQYLQ